MKFELRISSYGGLVPGAKHYRGRVQGEHPQSCHGGRIFQGGHKDPEIKGKWTCREEHVLPERIEWDVEAPWTEGRYERWAAVQFEGDGPAQYLSEADLVRDAIGRFLGLLPSHWWEEKATPGQPGDELYLGRIPVGGDVGEPDGWGHCIAVVPSPELNGEAMDENAEAQADAEVDEAARLAAEGRGACQYCGGGYMLRKDGKVRKHSISGTKAACGGGDREPR